MVLVGIGKGQFVPGIFLPRSHTKISPDSANKDDTSSDVEVLSNKMYVRSFPDRALLLWMNQALASPYAFFQIITISCGSPA